jgi:two-component system, chemotaxis family, chemotaxis protein CheY
MSRTVVIIDDSKFLVKQLVDFFSTKLNYNVVATGHDGNQAVELYTKHKPELITLDITMPNKDGKAAIKEILDMDPEANVMMISAVKGPAMLECMKRGAKGYVEKPLKFNSDEFVEDFKNTIEEIFKNG